MNTKDQVNLNCSPSLSARSLVMRLLFKRERVKDGGSRRNIWWTHFAHWPVGPTPRAVGPKLIPDYITNLPPTWLIHTSWRFGFEKPSRMTQNEKQTHARLLAVHLTCKQRGKIMLMPGITWQLKSARGCSEFSCQTAIHTALLTGQQHSCDHPSCFCL